IFIPGGTQPLPQALLTRYKTLQDLAHWSAQTAGAIRASQTNIRTGPGQSYVPLAQLEAGAWVLPVARYQQWLQIDYTEARAWVRADLVALPAGLFESLPETTDFPPAPPVWVWPTHGVLTSPFGSRWGAFHNGIDIANVAWTPIVAARAG